MIYLDTSFLIPLYMLEATSPGVEAVLRGGSVEDKVVSRWSRTEFASALARNVRMNLQEEAAARALMRYLDADMKATFVAYTPVAEDFELAASMILEAPLSGLRVADALHLAIAKNQGATLYTLDKTLLRAAEAFGVASSDAGIGAL